MNWHIGKVLQIYMESHIKNAISLLIALNEIGYTNMYSNPNIASAMFFYTPILYEELILRIFRLTLWSVFDDW